jgi:plastocyanin
MCAHHEKEDHGGYGNLTGVAWSILVMGLSLAAVIILWVWFGYIGPTFSEDVLANQQAILREHFGLPVQEISDNPEILQTPPSLRNISQGQQVTTAGNDSATGAATTNATTNATSANATTTTNDTSQESGVEAGETAGTTIVIIAGSSVQGNPDYEPDDAKVSLSENIVWNNEDSVPHTATSGSGVEDPNSGKIFDTSIINGGEESSPVQLTGVKEGDEIPYYCQVHPFMTSKLTVVTSTTDDGADPSTNNTSSKLETGQEIATNTSRIEGNTTSNNSQPLEASGNVSNP